MSEINLVRPFFVGFYFASFRVIVSPLIIFFFGNFSGFQFFSLFNPEGIASGESGAMIGAMVLFAGGSVLFILGVAAFSKKDLHI